MNTSVKNYLYMCQLCRYHLCTYYLCYCRYHMTSIYDISVYEGLSRVIQRLIPQQPALERLLNGFALVSLMNVVTDIKI